MKPLPAPDVAGSTPGERFNNILRAILKVSKEDIIKEESKDKQRKERKKAGKRD